MSKLPLPPRPPPRPGPSSRTKRASSLSRWTAQLSEALEASERARGDALHASCSRLQRCWGTGHRGDGHCSSARRVGRNRRGGSSAGSSAYLDSTAGLLRGDFIGRRRLRGVARGRAPHRSAPRLSRGATRSRCWSRWRSGTGGARVSRRSFQTMSSSRRRQLPWREGCDVRGARRGGLDDLGRLSRRSVALPRRFAQFAW